jgi:hypothetical protein
VWPERVSRKAGSPLGNRLECHDLVGRSMKIQSNIQTQSKNVTSKDDANIGLNS